MKVSGRSDKWDGIVGTVQKVVVQAYGGAKDLYTIHKNDVGDVVKKDFSENVLSFFEDQLVAFHPVEAEDVVNHPNHYTQYPVEVIELTRHMPFDDGNVVKYVARSPFKGNRLQDLKKARWYLDDAIAEEEKKLEAAK